MDFIYLIFDGIAVVLGILLWYLSISNYRELPKKISTHNDSTYEPDAFGHKNYIFALPILGLVFFLFFQWPLQSPESFNYPTQVTLENKETQFVLALTMMRILRILFLLVFVNLTDYIIRRSKDKTAKPIAGFATILTGILFL